MTGTWYTPAPVLEALGLTTYEPAAGTGGFLLTNQPFAMTAADQIRAAIQRCVESNPDPSNGDDIAAAVLMAAAEALFPEKPEPLEPCPITTVKAINHAGDWSAWRAMKAAKERLQALAQQMDPFVGSS